MGGVSLSVPEDKLSSFMKIKEGEGTDEYIVIRNDKFTTPINFISFMVRMNVGNLNKKYLTVGRDF